MTGRELIEVIKKHPNIDMPICISVDYHPIDSGRRVFTTEFLEMVINDPSDIVLLFEGYSNKEVK